MLETSHEGEESIVVVVAAMFVVSDERLVWLTLLASVWNKMLLLYSQIRRSKLSI